MQPLVSIIIPTYNRAPLLGETLNSVLAQTYKNWECIVVDDSSTDATDELMRFYSEMDSRIQYYHRPSSLPKGANACRNYGLDLTTGEYIIFFDSDDLMTQDHIEIKYEALIKAKTDYVIAKTKYLNTTLKDEFYNFSSEEINANNYIIQKVNWLTYDVFIKADLAKTIRFNERLQSGQEYNYFSKLTVISTSAILIDAYLTLRRYHEESIRGPLRENADLLLKSRFKSHWLTYTDLRDSLDLKTRRYLIMKCIGFVFDFKNYYKHFSIVFFKAICKEYGFRRAGNYLMANVVNASVGKGYFFVKRTRSI